MLSILRRKSTVLEKELMELRKAHERLKHTHSSCEEEQAAKDARIAELEAGIMSQVPAAPPEEVPEPPAVTELSSQLDELKRQLTQT